MATKMFPILAKFGKWFNWFGTRKGKVNIHFFFTSVLEKDSTPSYGSDHSFTDLHLVSKSLDLGLEEAKSVSKYTLVILLDNSND